MKIFNWMRNKLNGKDNSKPFPESVSHHMTQQSCKEEFSDWPNTLLAIGTLGNNNLKDSDKSNINNQGSSHIFSQDDQQENDEFDKELRQLLNKHMSLDSNDHNNLSIEKILDCLPEDAQSTDVSGNKADARLQRTTSVVQRAGGKDVHLDQKKKGIGKKSLYFLLKKALPCGGGFVPTPILRDPIPEAKLEKSRMEKILRAMLHKKIYPQRPGPVAASKKYLEVPDLTDSEDEENEEGGAGSKWVKTDSEYIVLEI